MTIPEALSRNEAMLAMLNNKAPKLILAYSGHVIIPEDFLWEFINENKNYDRDIVQFKKLEQNFNTPDRQRRSLEEIDACCLKMIEEKEKFFSKDCGYDPIVCDNIIKKYNDEFEKDLNTLDPETEKLFKECSQQLDKICAKYPDKISEFKKIYEEQQKYLLNELRLQQAK